MLIMDLYHQQAVAQQEKRKQVHMHNHKAVGRQPQAVALVTAVGCFARPMIATSTMRVWSVTMAALAMTSALILLFTALFPLCKFALSKAKRGFAEMFRLRSRMTKYKKAKA